jgi:serine/threonine protein kinase
VTRTSSKTPDFDIDTVAAGAARARTMAALFGPDAATPKRIAGYAVLDVLGRGAMGVVYLAHDERLDRSVALKLLDPGRRHDPKARASLVTEAKQIARVQHPNVVAVYEVGSHQGDTFLAMEYVAGPTLREWTLGA